MKLHLSTLRANPRTWPLWLLTLVSGVVILLGGTK